MTIKFEDSHYINVYLDNKNIDCFSLQREAHDTKNPKFSLSNITYQDYIAAPKTDGLKESSIWKRKLMVLPRLIIGIVSLIDHLALTVLAQGIILLCDIFEAEDSENLRKLRDSTRAGKYVFLRQIENLYGEFLTLFHDKLGSYHKEKSIFHINYYNQPYCPRIDESEDVIITMKYKETETTPSYMRATIKNDLAESDPTIQVAYLALKSLTDYAVGFAKSQ